MLYIILSDPADWSNAGNVGDVRIFTQSCPAVRWAQQILINLIHVFYYSDDPCSSICTIPKTAFSKGRPDEAIKKKTNLNCVHCELINLKWHVKKISLWPELGIMPCSMCLRFIWQFFNNIDQIKIVRKLESGNLPKYPPLQDCCQI